MRNPFRRQTDANLHPSLRERAADLRANLHPSRAAPAALPSPGSPEARAAWEDTCREHSKRTQDLPRHPELVRPEGGYWTTETLSKALDFGAIKPTEFARLYPLASEFALGLEQIGHDLNVHALFALAHAAEFPKESETASGDDVFPDAPADLADACLWAIRHRDWADRVSSVQDWSDERGDAELDRTSAVFTRAINEPSTNLREITAKAALALNDFELFTLRRGHAPDDGARIVHTVLREVVGVGRETSAFQAPGPVDLIAAAGLSVETLPPSDLCTIFDVAEILSGIASAIICQPRQMTKGNFNGAGLLAESVALALHAVMEAAAEELRRRTLTDASKQELRAVTLARLTIDNGDPAGTAAFARELLAMVEP